MSIQTIDSHVAYIAQALDERARDIVDAMLARDRIEAPAFFVSNDPAYVAAYTQSCFQHMQLIVRGLSNGRELNDELPAAAVEEARSCARQDIPLDSLVLTYRIGHSVIFEAAMDIAEVSIPDSSARSQVLRLVSRYLFDYGNRMMPRLTAAYESEREVFFRDRERHKRQAVRDVLNGLPVDATKIAYDLTGTHVAAVAWGCEPERTLTTLAERLGCQLLSVADPGNAIWAWFGGAGLVEQPARRILSEAPPEGAFLALGEPDSGQVGFRRSHAEALHAYRVGCITGAPVTRYADVALLALASQDMRFAREFVNRELGFLASNDSRSTVLRATLAAYFTTGHNASAAAAMLGVHDRTVAYRIRSIEERLGYSVMLRSVELSVALRLAEMLDRADLPEARFMR